MVTGIIFLNPVKIRTFFITYRHIHSEGGFPLEVFKYSARLYKWVRVPVYFEDGKMAIGRETNHTNFLRADR